MEITKVSPLTFAIVHQQSTGPTHIDEVSNLHLLQVLAHLTTLRELGVGVLEVDLYIKQYWTNQWLFKATDFLRT